MLEDGGGGGGGAAGLLSPLPLALYTGAAGAPYESVSETTGACGAPYPSTSLTTGALGAPYESTFACDSFEWDCLGDPFCGGFCLLRGRCFLCGCRGRFLLGFRLFGGRPLVDAGLLFDLLPFLLLVFPKGFIFRTGL